jgi:hypothetical protein
MLYFTVSPGWYTYSWPAEGTGINRNKTKNLKNLINFS